MRSITATNRPVLSALLLLLAFACRDAPQRTPPEVPGGDAERGRELLASVGCNSCHIIPGVATATGAVGPPLADFGDRAFVAGRLRNEPDNLMLWIREPQRVRPGTAMPNLNVSESDARHMAAYLYTLSSNGRRPGPVTR